MHITLDGNLIEAVATILILALSLLGAYLKQSPIGADCRTAADYLKIHLTPDATREIANIAVDPKAARGAAANLLRIQAAKFGINVTDATAELFVSDVCKALGKVI